MNQYYRNKRTGDYLMHSDSYMGADFSDSLCHWKYISKEKVNGKWRYYYTSKVNSLRNTTNDLRLKAQDAKAISDESQRITNETGFYAGYKSGLAKLAMEQFAKNPNNDTLGIYNSTARKANIATNAYNDNQTFTNEKLRNTGKAIRATKKAAKATENAMRSYKQDYANQMSSTAKSLFNKNSTTTLSSLGKSKSIVSKGVSYVKNLIESATTKSNVVGKAATSSSVNYQFGANGKNSANSRKASASRAWNIKRGG